MPPGLLKAVGRQFTFITSRFRKNKMASIVLFSINLQVLHYTSRVFCSMCVHIYSLSGFRKVFSFLLCFDNKEDFPIWGSFNMDVCIYIIQMGHVQMMLLACAWFLRRVILLVSLSHLHFSGVINVPINVSTHAR